MSFIVLRSLTDLLLWCALTALIWPLPWWQMALAYVVVGGIQFTERLVQEAKYREMDSNRDEWMKSALEWQLIARQRGAPDA